MSWFNDPWKIIGMVGGIIIATASATAFLTAKSYDLAAKASDAALKNCEFQRDTAIKDKEAVNVNINIKTSELSSCKKDYSQCQSELNSVLSCQIPQAPLVYSTNAEGVKNDLSVSLRGTQQEGASRLFAAVRVEGYRGGRSWWVSEVLAHRNGKQTVPFYLGSQRPGEKLVPVILKELVSGRVRSGMPLTRNGIDFSELCSMYEE